MQMIAIITKALLVASVVSAAKLPLSPSSGNLPVSPLLSTLYEAPLEDVPLASQSTSQILAELPLIHDEPSSLYEAPSEDISSLPALELGLPSSQGGPIEDIFAPSQEDSALQAANNPVVSLEQIQSLPVQQSTINVVPVPAEPSGLYELPVDSLQSPAQQTFVSQIFEEDIPVPVEPASLYETPIQSGGVAAFNTQGAPSQETIISQSTFQDSVAPAVPSGLYEVPQEVSPFQAESGVIQSQIVPVQNVQHIREPAQIPSDAIIFPDTVPFDLAPVPAAPSSLYETPDVAPSTIYEIPAAASEPIASVAKNMMLMPYNFQWGVEDGTNAFTHSETSDGQTTSGEYRVTLPDGRVQVVNFYDNGNGFHADVTYE